MKIPKKLKIIGFEWGVIKDKKGDDVIYEGACYGSTHPSSQKIFLDSSATRQNKEKAFIHEILHALWWQMGLGKRKDIDKKLEEEIIDPLATGLYQVLKENGLIK